jgi:phospholipid/cholesterol/gamma-HCH transport system substrate-binding protein
MLKNLGTEFKVGLFTLVALITLGYMFVMLGSDLIDSTNYRTYNTVLRDAAGIIPKTHVKTNGLTVGRVKEVRLDRETFSTRVVIEVDENIQILEGTKIEVRSVGLLGDKFLEIIRSGSGAVIADEGFIPESTNNVDMQALIALGGEIARDIKSITATLSNVLGTKEGEETITTVLQNIKAISEDLAKTSGTIRNVIGERETDLNRIVTNIDATVADFRSFSSNLKEVLDDENKERFDRILARFDDSMEDVKGATNKIRLISEKIEKGEGTIGKLLNDDKAITELEAAIKDIRQVLAPARKLEISVDYHSEARLATENTSHQFNLKFQTRPDRWYLLGIVDTGAEHTRETTTEVFNETPSDGAASRTRETIKEERTLKFNAQIAKRWYDAALRFGLFESSGGFAADFFLFRDRMRVSAEAFDWQIKDNPVRRVAHLRLYASILFWNHVQFLVGVNDPLRLECPDCKVAERPDLFFGAGLAFTDEDLKALFGTAALASSAN